MGLCPWPAGGENPGQVGEVGGRVPVLPLLFLGVGDVPFVLFAQLWTLRPNLTCSRRLSPGVNPGLQSLIPWDRNGPRRGFFPTP